MRVERRGAHGPRWARSVCLPGFRCCPSSAACGSDDGPPTAGEPLPQGVDTAVRGMRTFVTRDGDPARPRGSRHGGMARGEPDSPAADDVDVLRSERTGNDRGDRVGFGIFFQLTGDLEAERAGGGERPRGRPASRDGAARVSASGRSPVRRYRVPSPARYGGSDPPGDGVRVGPRARLGHRPEPGRRDAARGRLHGGRAPAGGSGGGYDGSGRRRAGRRRAGGGRTWRRATIRWRRRPIRLRRRSIRRGSRRPRIRRRWTWIRRKEVDPAGGRAGHRAAGPSETTRQRSPAGQRGGATRHRGGGHAAGQRGGAARHRRRPSPHRTAWKRRPTRRRRRRRRTAWGRPPTPRRRRAGDSRPHSVSRSVSWWRHGSPAPLAAQEPEAGVGSALGQCSLRWSPLEADTRSVTNRDVSGAHVTVLSGRYLWTCGTATMEADSAIKRDGPRQVELLRRGGLRGLDKDAEVGTAPVLSALRFHHRRRERGTRASDGSLHARRPPRGVSASRLRRRRRHDRARAADRDVLSDQHRVAGAVHGSNRRRPSSPERTRPASTGMRSSTGAT